MWWFLKLNRQLQKIHSLTICFAAWTLETGNVLHGFPVFVYDCKGNITQSTVVYCKRWWEKGLRLNIITCLGTIMFLHSTKQVGGAFAMQQDYKRIKSKWALLKPVTLRLPKCDTICIQCWTQMEYVSRWSLWTHVHCFTREIWDNERLVQLISTAVTRRVAHCHEQRTAAVLYR